MRIAVIVFVAAIVGCHSALRSDNPCRPLAEVERTGPGTLEIRFSRSIGRVDNGNITCDSTFIVSRVDDPKIAGKPLDLKLKGDQPIYFIRDASIDITDPLMFQMDGKSYIQDSTSIERTENRVRNKAGGEDREIADDDARGEKAKKARPTPPALEVGR